MKRLLIIFYPSGKLNLGARGLDIPRASASQFGQFKLSLLKRKKSYFFFYYGFYYHTGASLIVHLVKNMPAMQETPVWFLGWEDPLEKGLAIHSSILGFPCGSAGKESACNAGDLGTIPGFGRSSEEGKGYPLQSSGLDNSMDSVVHGVAKSQTWLSDFLHCCSLLEQYQVFCSLHCNLAKLLGKPGLWESFSEP